MLGSCCQKDKTHRRSSKDRAKCFYVGFRHNVNRVQREGSIEMMKILIRPLITFSRTHTHTVLHIRTKQSGWHFMKNKMPTESCVCVQDRRDEGTGKWNCIKHIHTYIQIIVLVSIAAVAFGTAYVLLHFTNKFKTTNNSLDWLENIYNGNKNACLNISNTKFDITHPLQLIKYFYHKYRGHMLVLVVVVHFVEK